jgi:hypothetical protein
MNIKTISLLILGLLLVIGGYVFLNNTQTPSVPSDLPHTHRLEIVPSHVPESMVRTPAIKTIDLSKKYPWVRTAGQPHDSERAKNLIKDRPNPTPEAKEYIRLWNLLVTFDLNQVELEYVTNPNFIHFVDNHHILRDLMSQDLLDSAWWLIDHGADKSGSLSGAAWLLYDKELRPDDATILSYLIQSGVDPNDIGALETIILTGGPTYLQELYDAKADLVGMRRQITHRMALIESCDEYKELQPPLPCEDIIEAEPR